MDLSECRQKETKAPLYFISLRMSINNLHLELEITEHAVGPT